MTFKESEQINRNIKVAQISFLLPSSSFSHREEKNAVYLIKIGGILRKLQQKVTFRVMLEKLWEGQPVALQLCSFITKVII